MQKQQHTSVGTAAMTRARGVIFGVLATALAVAAAAAPASAEVRTAHYRNPGTYTGSATNPQVESMTLRYDTTLGSLDLSVVFFHPLADPTNSAALRHASLNVSLGDAYGGNQGPGCDRGRDGIFVEAGLGSLSAPRLGEDALAPLAGTGTTTFSRSRDEIDVSVQSARLRHLNLICADAWVSNGVPLLTDFVSEPFLFNGFTVYDGNTTWSAESELEDQARWLDYDLGAAPHAQPHGEAFHCQPLSPDTFRCQGERRMPSIVGKPTLRIAGTQSFQLRHGILGDQLFWRHHATISGNSSHESGSATGKSNSDTEMTTGRALSRAPPTE